MGLSLLTWVVSWSSRQAVAVKPGYQRAQKEHRILMSPFGNYRHIVPATARKCPSGRCVVCWSPPAQLRQVFAAVVCESWSPDEIDLLSKAARAALL